MWNVKTPINKNAMANALTNITGVLIPVSASPLVAAYSVSMMSGVVVRSESISFQDVTMPSEFTCSLVIPCGRSAVIMESFVPATTTSEASSIPWSSAGVGSVGSGVGTLRAGVTVTGELSG